MYVLCGATGLRSGAEHSAQSHLVVADVRVQCRDKHQAAAQQVIDALSVGLDARAAVVREALARVA